MRIKSSPFTQAPKDSGAVQLLLWEAKRLHRAAASDTRLKALPVLRRLIKTQTLRDISLPELYRTKDRVQRKHVLNMLAAEAGYSDWPSYKQAISCRSAEELQRSSLVMRSVGYPNLWFSSYNEAEQYTSAHGGEPIAVGHQAVVIIEE